MYIDNSIGMTLFTSDSSGVCASGNQAMTANGTAFTPEGSLFQQMITQMLTVKNQMTEATLENLSTGVKANGDATAGMFTELLLTGGNPANIRLQNAGMATVEHAEALGDNTEVLGETTETQAIDDGSRGMEMIQALMAGMTSSALPAIMVKPEQNAQIDKPAAESPLAAIKPAEVMVPDRVTMEPGKPATNNAVQQFDLNKAAVQTSAEKAISEGITPTQDERNILYSQAETLKAETSSNPQISRTVEKAVQTAETDFSGLKQPAPMEQNPEASVLQVMKPTEADNGKQVMTGIKGRSEFEVSADKPKFETETAAAAEPDKLGAQISLSAAAAKSDLSELNLMTRAVENPEPYSQIKGEILTKLEQNGPTEFKMQLHPEDLGQIDIKLKISEGKLIIDILAANSKTQALLTNQVDKLVASMGLQNVQVESVQVYQQTSSQTQDNSQNQGYSMNSAMDFSQRRQQEQYQHEFANNSKQSPVFSLKQDEAQKDNAVNRTEAARYNFHRMNYSV